MYMEYAVFVLLLLGAVICYIAYEMQPKEEAVLIDREKVKAESPK